MAKYQYRFANYSFQDSARAAAAHAAIDAMCEDGWHVHSATVNYIEAGILWERGSSATGDRVQAHLEEKGALPSPRSRRKSSATQDSEEPPEE
jgi:hypothetical protein